MKRTLAILLLLVVMLMAVHNAVAEDLDLTKMSNQELQQLKYRITVELQSRPKESSSDDQKEKTDEQKEKREAIGRKYQKWLEKYDFESILSDVQAKECELPPRCAAEIEQKAMSARDLMNDCIIESDEFTGDFQIFHKTLKSFGSKGQVFPYLDKDNMKLVVGFPYKSAMHYDKIYLSIDRDIEILNRFDKESGFDIQFEKVNGKSWEYSLLSDMYYVLGLSAISFREEGSVQKEDYVLKQNEMIAVNAISSIASARRFIAGRIETYVLTGY